MAIFKCKMCGGVLNVDESTTVMECEYCGTKQTLPRLTTDERANLYDRANHYRRNSEYDKAMSLFEEIIHQDESDAESYWSLVLCKYGIEYVEDPLTHKRVPTVNRIRSLSILADEDYKSALKYADRQQKLVYEEEARAINIIHKDILSISKQVDPFDVFICYKETDDYGKRTVGSVLAYDIYHYLEAEGIRTFISRVTLDDKLGSAYEPYIFSALSTARIMVVVGTKAEHFNAAWVKNEWSRYLSLIKEGADKILIPAYKDMDPYDLPDDFAHLQALDMSRIGFMQDLIRGIKKILEIDPVDQKKGSDLIIGNKDRQINALLERTSLFLEEENWEKADQYAEKVLDLDPKNVTAYLYKLMVEIKVSKVENIANLGNRKAVLEIDSSDELFEKVAYSVVRNGSVSINSIQKEFEIGFNRAQRILKALEDFAIVSHEKERGPRTVLMTIEKLNLLCNKDLDKTVIKEYFRKNANYQKILRFGDEEFIKNLTKQIDNINS
jgi:tetratricopeptide (TPR) repeat protein